MEMTHIEVESRLRCIDAMKNVKWMLNVVSIWPLRNPTKFYIFKFVANWMVTSSFVLSIIFELCMYYTDLAKLNELLCTLLPVFMYHVKVGVMHYRKDNFLNVLNLLDSDLFNSHGDKLDKPLRKIIRSSERTRKFFQILTLVVVLFYATFPLLDGKGLPVPFSIDLGHYRYLMHILQVVAISLCAWNLSTMDLLFMIFMNLISAQIDVLRSKLMDVREDAMVIWREKYGVEKGGSLDGIIEILLKECVILHEGIIRMVNELELVYSLPMLLQFVTGMILVCSSILQLITIPPGSAQFVLSCQFVLIVLTQQSLYHVFGNDIIFKSNEISEACYLSEWYNCNLTAQKMMLMIMKRAKEPLGITVHKFTKVSLASFGTMIRWAYSFVALIRVQQQRERG